MPASQAAPACIQLQGIDLTDNKVFPLDQQQRLLDAYIGQCITPEMLATVLSVISEYYQNLGLVTTRPYLQNQDISDGTLLVTVLIGRVNSVNLLPESIASSRTDGLLPRPGDLLNLSQLEYAITTIERVPSATAEFEIVPANVSGFSDINMNIVDTASWMLEAGVLARNNNNTDLSLGFRLDNPLQRNDLLWLRHNSGEVITSTANNYANQLDYSIPLWGSLFSFSASDSSYQQAVQGQVGSYLSEGERIARSLEWRFPVSDAVNGQWYSGLVLSAERTRSFFENELIEVSSYDSEEWGVVLQYDSNGSSLTDVNLQYRYLIGGGDDGESYFNSIEGFDSAANPEAARQLLSLNLSTASDDLRRKFHVRSSLQAANDLLRQNRKLSLGSFATVRGYQSALSGSEGWFIGADYEWDFPARDNKSVTINLGLDYGEVDCEIDNRDICGSISGLGAGWLLADANFSAQLLAGFPLQRLPDSEADDGQLLINLLWRL